MPTQIEYTKGADEHGFVYRYTHLTLKECNEVLGRDYPEDTAEEVLLCQRFKSRVIEVGAGVIFKPYDSK